MNVNLRIVLLPLTLVFSSISSAELPSKRKIVFQKQEIFRNASPITLESYKRYKSVLKDPSRWECQIYDARRDYPARADRQVYFKFEECSGHARSNYSHMKYNRVCLKNIGSYFDTDCQTPAFKISDLSGRGYKYNQEMRGHTVGCRENQPVQDVIRIVNPNKIILEILLQKDRPVDPEGPLTEQSLSGLIGQNVVDYIECDAVNEIPQA